MVSFMLIKTLGPGLLSIPVCSAGLAAGPRVGGWVGWGGGWFWCQAPACNTDRETEVQCSPSARPSGTALGRTQLGTRRHWSLAPRSRRVTEEEAKKRADKGSGAALPWSWADWGAGRGAAELWKEGAGGNCRGGGEQGTAWMGTSLACPGGGGRAGRERGGVGQPEGCAWAQHAGLVMAQGLV